MIRKRNPATDDRKILALIKNLLFPFAQRSNPDLTFQRKDIFTRLRRGVTYITEQKRGKPQGFVHVLTRDDKLWVDMIAVDKAAQGKGIGSRLLEKAEAYGQKKGCTSANLFVDSVNGHAQQFYRRHGYRELRYVPEVKCYLYAKPLQQVHQPAVPPMMWPEGNIPWAPFGRPFEEPQGKPYGKPYAGQPHDQQPTSPQWFVSSPYPGLPPGFTPGIYSAP